MEFKSNSFNRYSYKLHKKYVMKITSYLLIWIALFLPCACISYHHLNEFIDIFCALTLMTQLIFFLYRIDRSNWRLEIHHNMTICFTMFNFWLSNWLFVVKSKTTHRTCIAYIVCCVIGTAMPYRSHGMTKNVCHALRISHPSVN